MKKKTTQNKNFTVKSERFHLMSGRDPLTRRKITAVRGVGGGVSFALRFSLNEEQCEQLGRLLDKAYEHGCKGMAGAVRNLLEIR